MTSNPKLPHGQHVTLRLADEETVELEAQVDTADEELITLVLSMKPDEDVRPVRGEPVVVEYTTRRGVTRINGTIDGYGDREEVIHVRRDDFDVIQRRDFVRVDAVVPLRVTITSPVRGAAHTSTLNVSGGGLLLHDPLGLPFGAEVEIELELDPGGPPVRAYGRVVREVGEEAKGVQIETIATEDRERLIRYVLERERLALRVARGRL